MALTTPAGDRYRICIEGHFGNDWIDWPYEVENQPGFDQELGICGFPHTLTQPRPLHGEAEEILDTIPEHFHLL